MVNQNTNKYILLAIALLSLSCVVIVVWKIGSFVWCFGGGCPISETRTDSGVRLTLWLPQSRYENGEPVSVRATIENVTRKTIVIDSGGDSPVLDIKYIDGEDIAWSKVHPDLAIGHLELKPGEKFEANMTIVVDEINQSHSFTATAYTPLKYSSFTISLPFCVGACMR